jgi:hypothetical protein
MRRHVLCFALACLSAAGAAQEGFPITTDRGTTFSSSSSTIPVGRWQIEAGYTRTRAAGATTETFGEFALRYPLNPKLEARFGGLSWIRVPGSDGFVDPTVGFKYRFLDAAPGQPEASVIVQSSLPLGDRGFRVDRWQPTVQLPWFLMLDDQTGVGGMLSASDLGASGSRFTQFGGGAYVSRILNPQTTAYFEVYGITPLSPSGPSGGFANVCVTYLTDKATQLDFRIGSGFDQDRDGWHIGAGISVRF